MDKIEHCRIMVGSKNMEKYGLNGDCDSCEHYASLGVHKFCSAPVLYCARVITFDCAVTAIRSTVDNNVRCLNCDVLLNPKTARCSECLKTEELKNFKEKVWKKLWWMEE